MNRKSEDAGSAAVAQCVQRKRIDAVFRHFVLEVRVSGVQASTRSGASKAPTSPRGVTGRPIEIPVANNNFGVTCTLVENFDLIGIRFRDVVATRRIVVIDIAPCRHEAVMGGIVAEADGAAATAASIDVSQYAAMIGSPDVPPIAPGV